ncbi:MAG: fibronectin type III domain-containing protein [Chloroflexi bacterium]|nr:fibronectin type III domain-containing protein [Chloroflexota bacterium]
MKAPRSVTEPLSIANWPRVCALALAVVLAIVFMIGLFTTAISRADGPPDLGGAFTLPFKLEQGRPPPARASSVPRQPDSLTTPTPTPTPGGTPAPAKPDAPTGVNAYPLSYSLIEVEWDEHKGNVDGFELQVSPDGSDGSWQLLAGKARLKDPGGRLYNWYQHRGLGGHQARHYRVRATNGNARSEWSSSASATTLSTGRPRMSVAALDEFNLKISWQMPRAFAEVTGWELEVTTDAPEPTTVTYILPLDRPGGYLVRQPRQQSNRQWTRLATPAVGDRSYTHSGLQPSDKRYYRIRAVTDEGTASWSGGVDHGTTLKTTRPAAPRLVVEANGATEVVLTWTEPADRGYPITGYEWQESADGREWTDLGSGSADQTKATINIGETGAFRYYRVRAQNVRGSGAWSHAASLPLGEGTASRPESLKATGVGDTWVDLEWGPAIVGDSPITGYHVQWKKGGYDGTGWTNIGATGPLELTLRDTDLEPGVWHSYRVAARDQEGLGPWTFQQVSVKTVVAPPSAPTLTAQAQVRDSGPHAPAAGRYQVWIKLSWTEPRDGGSPPFSYEIERSPNGDGDWKELSFVRTGKVSTEDHGVGFGWTMYYRVKARNKAGGGPWSNVASATTRAAPPYYLPFLKPEDIGEDQIEIGWKPPDNDGGSPVTGYEIQASTGGYSDDSKFSTVARPSASASTYIHRNLKPDTRYCYRYRAKNSVGWSDWQRGTAAGKDHCFHTDAMAPVAPATPSITVAATTITVDGSEIEGVKVSWTQPVKKGVTVIGFFVSISHDETDWRAGGNAGADDGSFTISYADLRNAYPELEELTKVYFRAQALASGVDSAWSPTVSIAIPDE